MAQKAVCLHFSLDLLQSAFFCVSLKTDSLLCHLVIGLERYSQVYDKLLSLPEEIYQEFPFLLSGQKFEMQ